MIYSVLFDVHECFACMYVSALLEYLVPLEAREATGSLELSSSRQMEGPYVRLGV